MKAGAHSALGDDSVCRGFHLALEKYEATLLIRVAGDFDLSTVDRVDAVLGTRDAATRHILFDLRAVTFLDMAAMLTLIKTNERAHTESFEVQIVPPLGLARRVFTLTRAGDQLTLVDKAPALAGPPSRW